MLRDLLTPEEHADPYVWAAVFAAHAWIGAAGWGGYYMRAIIHLNGGQRLEGPRLKRVAENTMEVEFGRVWGQDFSGGATAVFDPGDCFFYAGLLT